MEVQQAPERSDDLYGLNPKEEAAIQALISSPTLKQAAAAAGISDTTLWRWLRKEHFRKAYLDARRRAVQQSYARFQHLACEVPGVLYGIMTDDRQSGASRIAAGKMILDSARKGFQFDEMEAVPREEK